MEISGCPSDSGKFRSRARRPLDLLSAIETSTGTGERAAPDVQQHVWWQWKRRRRRRVRVGGGGLQSQKESGASLSPGMQLFGRTSFEEEGQGEPRQTQFSSHARLVDATDDFRSLTLGLDAPHDDEHDDDAARECPAESAKSRPNSSKRRRVHWFFFLRQHRRRVPGQRLRNESGGDVEPTSSLHQTPPQADHQGVRKGTGGGVGGGTRPKLDHQRLDSEATNIGANFEGS